MRTGHICLTREEFRMIRQIYTYSDLTKLRVSRTFAQIKKYPIITVTTDLRKGLKGRMEVDQVNGIFRSDESVHVTDFGSFMSVIDKDWGSDQSAFNQMVILSEYLRGRQEQAAGNEREKTWLIGCRRNLGRMHAAIKQLEEAQVKPEDLDLEGDRNLELLADAWKVLRDRDPVIRKHHARMASLGEKSAWEPVFSDAFRMADVSSVNTLVFMGFYYISSQQEHVMQLLEQAGFRLLYLIPYDSRAPFVHEIWDRTYMPEHGYAPKAEWHMENSSAENPWGDIFEGKAVTLPNKVQVREYATMMEFVNSVKHILEKGYAIYSSDFRTANQVLKEYFPEEYGERKILSYPIGQFIGNLNQMWDEERQTIVLDEDRLIECFSSGWLSKNGIAGRQYLQELMDILPYFAGCTRADEWEERIRILQQIRRDATDAFEIEKDPDPAVARWQEAICSPLANISTFSVDNDKLDIILALIQQLLQMAGELFHGNEAVMIQDHVRNLDYILRQNEVSDEMYTEERELVAELFETLAAPAEFTAKCYPADIAQALNLYINGHLSDGELLPKTVGLVHPMYFVDAACIKNNSKVHICLCDVNSMPGKNREYIWPLSETVMQKCLARTGNCLIWNMMYVMEVSPLCNRYFMYSALRNQDVQLSWVSVMNEKQLARSSYLKLIMEAAGLELKPAIRDQITNRKVAESPWANEFTKPYSYDEIPRGTVKEAKMDYALCPMRYVLGYVLEKHPSYQSEFQQNYAINAIISAIHGLMKDEGMTVDEIYHNMIMLFPNLRRIEKQQLYDYIANDHGETAMNYSGRTQCGEWFITDERLKIHFPARYARERSLELYGKQSTPDRRDGMNLFEEPKTEKDRVYRNQEICAFCPQVSSCRRALFYGNEDWLYD